jgi:hypothetical protein
MQQRFQGQGWNAIKTADVLAIEPSSAWLAEVDPAQQPKYAMVKAQLWLKVKEDEKAFPHIAQLAQSHPPQAKELVNEFLRVWTTNHDPNEARNQGRAYWMYGYEPRAEGIPLTRSKQNRNLEELGQWIGRIKGLGLGDPDEQLLAKAFTTCHSSAEVYRTEAIEAVFGNLAQIKPKTLAALAQQMRQNLGGLWRLPAVQDKAKTKRKTKDIMQEVLRGYQVAGEVVQQALRKFPDDWSLLLAGATIGHDLNNYHRELARDSKFTERRELTFELFAQAAAAYAAKVGAIPRDEESTEVYEHWFYAALGASDLAAVTEETVPNQKEIVQIKAAIDGLPGDAAERHRGRFANTLFTRMSAAKPPVKFRYLKYGFEIVGDHKQAYEAKKVFDYYKDLVTEIRLQVQVDGADTVGTEQPFGVFVNLLHTREIERESGGFGRYLQNQASMSYSYNYGRPPENYRDKFSEAARQALGEHFEVLSVTFQQETVTSRATADYGWRVTPYAYLLLKPRGPQIDHIPPLRFDLDFMDTSGYAVLPVESPKVPIDAGHAGPPRPAQGIEVTQILDERQQKDGKLLLEVKATARGLVPDLASLVAIAPAGFAIDKTEDSGVQVSRFDPDAEGNLVVSERTWNLTLKGKDGLPELPKTFAFGTPRGDGVKMLKQRYVDADLVTVDGAEIALEGRYGKAASTWPWFVGIGALVCGALGFLFVSRRRRPTLAAATGLRMPHQVTPFTVLGLLRAIGQEPQLDAATRGELDATIERIESHFFGKASDEGLDLQSVARSWLERTRQHAG